CSLLTGLDRHRVGDAGNAFLLLVAQGGKKGARGHDQDLVQFSPAHPVEHMPVGDTGGTGATAGTGLNGLVLPVDHQSAITETVRGKLQPLFGQQLGRKGMADPSQVPGQDRPSPCGRDAGQTGDRKSTRLNSSHVKITYAVFSLKIKKCTFE